MGYLFIGMGDKRCGEIWIDMVSECTSTRERERERERYIEGVSV